MSTATSKKAVKGCECLDLCNKTLAEKGVKLQTRMQMDFKTGTARMIGPVLAVEKIDPKSRVNLPTIIATYCPICGKRTPGTEKGQ